MMTYYDASELSFAYKLLAALYSPDVLEEGVKIEFPPYELTKEMKDFRKKQDAYFEGRQEKQLRRFMAAIYQMKLATKELVRTLESEVA